MAKEMLSEVQLRNALAMVAGADPNGCFFVANEINNSDIAISAAFGAIVAAENSGKPQAHLINYTAYGLYFIPIYFQKKTGYVLAPEQNFFIPHQEIESVAVVGSGWKFYEIRIKTANGRKFRFNTVRKKKEEAYHAANVSRFREIYAADSKKAERKGKITSAVVAVFLLLILIGAIVLAVTSDDTDAPQSDAPQSVQSYMAGDERIPLDYYTIDDTFSMLLPSTFTDLSDAEFAKIFPDSTGFACANAERTVYVAVCAWNAGEKQLDADALKAEYAQSGEVLSAQNGTRNGFQFAEVKAVKNAAGEYIHTVEFETNGTFYAVSFIAEADARAAWEGASDRVLLSIDF